MFRWTGPIVAFLFTLVSVAPSLFLVQFQVRRAFIERELCVQRDVVEAMRTCHGECQLSKRFKALEHEAEAGFPAERISVRQEPQIPLDHAMQAFVPSLVDRVFPVLVEAALSQVIAIPEQVPRS